MSTRARSSGLSRLLWSFVTAVYIEWVVIAVTKHFDDLFRTGASQLPLFSREGYAGLFAFSVLFVTLIKQIHFRPDALTVAMMALPALALNSYLGIGSIFS